MRCTTGCFAFAIAVLSSCARDGSPEPVYRYINITDGTRILLGERFTRTDFAEQLNDTTFRLRQGAFAGGGTTSIVGYTDRTGVLRSLRFVYDGSEPLSVKVRNYTASLGNPAERHQPAEGGIVYVWQDLHTRFELHYKPHQTPAFWSQLIDRTRS